MMIVLAEYKFLFEYESITHLLYYILLIKKWYMIYYDDSTVCSGRLREGRLLASAWMRKNFPRISANQRCLYRSVPPLWFMHVGASVCLCGGGDIWLLFVLAFSLSLFLSLSFSFSHAHLFFFPLVSETQPLSARSLTPAQTFTQSTGRARWQLISARKKAREYVFLQLRIFIYDFTLCFVSIFFLSQCVVYSVTDLILLCVTEYFAYF